MSFFLWLILFLSFYCTSELSSRDIATVMLRASVSVRQSPRHSYEKYKRTARKWVALVQSIEGSLKETSITEVWPNWRTSESNSNYCRKQLVSECIHLSQGWEKQPPVDWFYRSTRCELKKCEDMSWPRAVQGKREGFCERSLYVMRRNSGKRGRRSRRCCAWKRS